MKKTAIFLISVMLISILPSFALAQASPIFAEELGNQPNLVVSPQTQSQQQEDSLSSFFSCIGSPLKCLSSAFSSSPASETQQAQQSEQPNIISNQIGQAPPTASKTSKTQTTTSSHEFLSLTEFAKFAIFEHPLITAGVLFSAIWGGFPLALAAIPVLYTLDYVKNAAKNKFFPKSKSSQAQSGPQSASQAAQEVISSASTYKKPLLGYEAGYPYEARWTVQFIFGNGYWDKFGLERSYKSTLVPMQCYFSSPTYGRCVSLQYLDISPGSVCNVPIGFEMSINPNGLLGNTGLDFASASIDGCTEYNVSTPCTNVIFNNRCSSRSYASVSYSKDVVQGVGGEVSIQKPSKISTGYVTTSISILSTDQLASPALSWAACPGDSECLSENEVASTTSPYLSYS